VGEATAHGSRQKSPQGVRENPSPGSWNGFVPRSAILFIRTLVLLGFPVTGRARGLDFQQPDRHRQRTRSHFQQLTVCRAKDRAGLRNMPCTCQVPDAGSDLAVMPCNFGTVTRARSMVHFSGTVPRPAALLVARDALVCGCIVQQRRKWWPMNRRGC